MKSMASPDDRSGNGTLIAALIGLVFVLGLLLLRERMLRLAAEKAAEEKTGAKTSSSAIAPSTQAQTPKAEVDTSGTTPKPGPAIVAAPKIGGATLDFNRAMDVIDLDGDGTEDLLAGFTIQGAKDTYVGAFDGKTHVERWRVGPFGQTRHSIFRAGRHELIVVDDAAKLHVFGLARGDEKLVTGLTDLGARIQFDPTGGQAWVESTDKIGVLVQLESPKVTPTARPSWATSERSRCFAPHASCVDDLIPPPGMLPEVPGMRGAFALFDGALGFVVGSHAPGTATPHLAAFVPKKLTVLWEADVADPADRFTAELDHSTTLADLRDGRLCVGYEVGSGMDRAVHLASFEAATGTKQWDVNVGSDPSAFGAISIGREHVYAAMWGRIHVVETATGAPVATLGR
jgi:hypothetical protein